MARLPQPGSDDGRWGGILNDYLLQAHDANGSIKLDSVSESQLSSTVRTKLNAIGSWSGITDKPTAFTPAAHTHVATDVSDSSVVGRAVLTADDAAAVRTIIGAGTGSSNLTLGTTSTTAKAGDYTPTKIDVGLDNVDNTTDADKPVSTAQAAAIDIKYTKPESGIPETDLSSAVQTKLNAAGAPFVVVENVEDVPPGTAIGTVVVVTG